MMQTITYTLLIITAILLLGTIILLCLLIYAGKKIFLLHAQSIKEEKERKITIEQLINDKASLEKQNEEYMQKINEYEHINEKQQEQLKERDLLSLMFIDDIIKIINKKIPKKEDYIELLKRIDKQFIYSLKSIYEGNLSIPNLKYCICFAIGMDVGEVSECFSIEQSSVHQVRYRLRKKFGLNNKDDLDVFLKQQLVNKNMF